MLKKVLAGTFLMAFIVINGVSVYADDTDIPDNVTPIVNIEDANIDKEQVNQVNLEDQDLKIDMENADKVKILEPDDKLITTDEVILLSGKGTEGTKVLIEVYSIPELVRNDFDFDNLPESDTYILSFDKIIKIGPSGVFGEELELKQGLNKIVIYVIEKTTDEASEDEINEDEVSEDEANEDEANEDEVSEEINVEEISNKEIMEKQDTEEVSSDSEVNKNDSNLDTENISEDIEKTKVVEKYVYIKDISQAKENLDSIKEPGSSPKLDIPSKLD